MAYTEANYENAVVQLIEQLGYTHVYGPDVERDYTDPLYSDVLEGALLSQSIRAFRRRRSMKPCSNSVISKMANLNSGISSLLTICKTVLRFPFSTMANRSMSGSI